MADILRRLLERKILVWIALLTVCSTIIFIGRIYVILIIWSFIAGIILCNSLINPDSLVPNLLRWLVRKKMPKPKTNLYTMPQQDDELSLLKKVCPVCGKDNCSRHRPELNIVALQPWTNLKIPEKVDDVLEEFMNLVLKEFVYTWYRDLGDDEAFVDELRTSLRFIVSVILRRVKKVDLTQFILDIVLKTAIRHLHFYIQLKQRAKSDADLQRAMLEYYGAHLHCAARNRQSELDYLRFTSERIFPYILPLQSLKCKGLCVLLREIMAGAILLPAMDKIADPDTLNTLLLVFFDCSQSPRSPPSLKEVPILANFGHPRNKNMSCLRLELMDILGNQEALFPFMQFMKTEASVNVLQFYLTAEEFNSKMLTPELTSDQLKLLHFDLNDLYRMYCAPNAADRIQFDDDIVTQLKQICDGPPEGVIKLQTTTPLFRAYEHAYTLLETTFLPLFHQSDDYYSMMCGERLPTKLSRSLSKTNKRPNDPLMLSRIGSKLKGVFKTNTVEGDALLEGIECAVEETGESLMRTDSYDDFLTDGLGFTVTADGRPLHDLSAWRVTIVEIFPRPDPDHLRKVFYIYIIEIRRVDVLEDDFEASNWRVERRYNDFYALEQKLSEFHGEFSDAILPPKKSFGTKSKEFLEARRCEFELYLQKLLTKPKLRGSELLHNFLTSAFEFTTGFDINLGKFVKSGALKLVKERGQHLEPFLQSLSSSIEASKPKPCRCYDGDGDTISISSEQMANSLYENNADMEFDLSPATPVVLCPGFEYPVDGACDTIIYIVEHLYHAPFWFMSSLMALRILFRSTIDTFLDWYLGVRLERALQEHHIVRLIELLRDALFFNTGPPRTDEEKHHRMKEALWDLKEYIPRLFVHLIGVKQHDEATELIIELLQYPKLNKQLSYMLLDAVIEELIPEVLIASEDDPLRELFRAARADD